MQQLVADLHLHSRYSRAVSTDMILPTMAKVALQKGIDLLTASDFTHTLWFKEIQTQLEEHAEGIYKLKSQITTNNQKDILFLLSTEIASIYTWKGKLRRIHNLVFAPNFEIAAKINQELLKRGCNLSSDGRPIIGVSSKDLLELILSIDERCMLIPCHIWTPHFGVYGSASGFDSLEEAFGELSSSIYAIETGLSSDPEMNWRIKELENRSIVSFSDAHSPAKMGREATVFTIQNSIPIQSGSKIKISYNDIAAAIKRDPMGNLKIGYTIEFYPEEGKYHFSGHRNCKVVLGPLEIKKEGALCPVCNRKLTEGVLFRVQQLANQQPQVELKPNSSGLAWFTDTTRRHPPFVKLVPLLEIVAQSLGSTVSSQKSKALFEQLCDTLGSEIDVLLKTPYDAITKVGGEKVREAVEKIRRGTIVIDPGYDGEYGKVKIWNKETPTNDKPQLSLI